MSSSRYFKNASHIPGNWVSLRTLIIVRWLAIFGQTGAIIVAINYFQLNVDVGLCSIAIGASVLANVISMFIYPENRRLSETELTAVLLFDTLQLGVLLYLTGGLNNPFAMLILAPVAISATALQARSTVIIGALVILLTSLNALYHQHLRTDFGFIMRLPDDFVLGFWVAIVITVLFIGIYAQRVATEILSMSRALLAAQMALSREQKLADLSGVVAATAHELGTPLATIKLTATELATDLPLDSDLRADAELIGQQADRCRDILHSMGRAGKGDKHIVQAPLTAVVEDAAEPHLDRGRDVRFKALPRDATSEPEIMRFPEVVHGLRNLVQNAVDFSASTVWVDMEWDHDQINLRIVDDGPGFSPLVIGRIGDPFVGRRTGGSTDNQRPGYEGMGLGLFIAKTLLERTGARLRFANGNDRMSGQSKPGKRKGAIVEVTWPMTALAPPSGGSRQALGENQPLDL